MSEHGHGGPAVIFFLSAAASTALWQLWRVFR